MSEFKGTKGKWEINHEERNSRGIFIECNNPNWDICNTATNFEEDSANALLISKSPEMLEMLIELREIFDKYRVDNEQQFFKYKQPLEQLIKEATEL